VRPRTDWIRALNRYSLLIGILLAAVVFSPDPGVSRASSAIHDFAHAPIFGCVALLLLQWLRPQVFARTWSVATHYLVAFSIAVVLGAATEIAQMFAHRDASWVDLRSDTLGALAFCGVYTILDQRVSRSAVRFVGVIGGALLLVWHSIPVVRVTFAYLHRNQDFPSLIDARDARADDFAKVFRAEGEYARLPTRFAEVDGERALHMRFGTEDWVGLDLDEPYPDWSNFGTLAMDLTNPNESMLDVSIRVHDRTHNWAFADRFNRTYRLAPQSRTTVRVPLLEIERAPLGRRLNLQHVANFQLFTSGVNAGRELYVSRIWLE